MSKPVLTEPLPQPLVSVSLTPYQWHEILEVIDNQLAIVNRDPTLAMNAYEAIASQLAGKPVKVTLNGRDPRAPAPVKAPESKPLKTPSLLQKLFHRLYSHA